MQSSQFCFDLKLGRQFQSRIGSSRQRGLCLVCIVHQTQNFVNVNVHEGDSKIEFLHPHGPGKTFNWPSVADKCFVPVSNILCIITAPTATTGRMYQISDTDSESI